MLMPLVAAAIAPPARKHSLLTPNKVVGWGPTRPAHLTTASLSVHNPILSSQPYSLARPACLLVCFILFLHLLRIILDEVLPALAEGIVYLSFVGPPSSNRTGRACVALPTFLLVRLLCCDLLHQQHQKLPLRRQREPTQIRASTGSVAEFHTTTHCLNQHAAHTALANSSRVESAVPPKPANPRGIHTLMALHIKITSAW